MKRKILIKAFSFIVVLIGVLTFSNVSLAYHQLTIYGANGETGDKDPYIQFSLDNGTTWAPASLYQGHPWGNISGTNSWINCGPSGSFCENASVLYRVQFYVPEDFTAPSISFEAKADNLAYFYLNANLVSVVNGTDNVLINANNHKTWVRSGLNEIQIIFVDQGGLAGLNFKITLSVESSAPPYAIDLTDTIPPTTTDDAPPDHWVNQPTTVNLTATDNPSGSGVVQTFYTVNGGAQQTGTSIVLETEGEHVIEYWSVDNVGNVETKKTKTVTVKLLPLNSEGGFDIGDVVSLINQVENREMNGDGIFNELDIMIMLRGITPSFTSIPLGTE